MYRLLECCSDVQREAITHGSGPGLVIAGPGSGKTFVITHRIQYLIKSLGISPENILVITFTKAAAVQLKERSTALLGESMPICFGTFHSVFFKILCASGEYSPSSIIKSHEKRRIIRELIEESEIDFRDEEELINQLLADISRYKTWHATSADNVTDFATSINYDDFLRIFNSYSNSLNKLKLVDFDDMLIKTYKILKGNRHFRQRFIDQFKYILIDEFQDIDPLQFDTVRLLLGGERNLFVVGDDDQSIYSFRGADNSIMLSFDKYFPDAHKIVLGTNYRCSGKIVEGALLLINDNKKRYEKDIKAFNKCGEEIIRLVFDDEKSECDVITKYILGELSRDELKSYGISKCGNREQFIDKALKKAETNISEAGINMNESIAVLSRTNAGIEYMAQKLNILGVSYLMKEKRNSIYDHFIVKDIAAYLRLALGDNSRSTFLKIMNKPWRGLSRAMLTDSEISFDSISDYYSVRGERKHKELIAIKKLMRDIKVIKGLKPYGAIKYILNVVGYKEYLKQIEKTEGQKRGGYFDTIESLLTDSKRFDSNEDWIKAINCEADEDKSCRDETSDAGAIKPRVTLSTIHGSKGLEYDTVFVINIAEGIIPYKRASDIRALEEERRLLYVAMTRARTNLVMCEVLSYNGKKCAKSSFVN